MKLLLAPIKVGYDTAIRPGGDVISYGDLLKEVHFIRRCLRNLGSVDTYRKNDILSPQYPMGF
jgi:hypothetical protein